MDHADRVACGQLAVAGRERALAVSSPPELLACRSGADAEAYLSALPDAARWYDFAAAAVLASWSGDADATLRCFRAASDAALAGDAAAIAIAARERLAQHALLFGDLAVARGALEDALTLAVRSRDAGWRARCAAFSARLALDTADVERAQALLDEAFAAPREALTAAFFAPTGAQLAAAAENHDELRRWSTPAIADVALRSDDLHAAAAATIACVLANGIAPDIESRAGIALRRALAEPDAAINAPELLSLAARFGDAEEARFGVDALRAVFAPHRPYLEAHFLLARAHWGFRFDERADAVDSAGDAARAFDAIGLRRWTDEAMQLLVHQEGNGDQHRRRRPTALSLTGREQQVAHLIRRGASNREVARTLQISEHTVERHVSSILSRLGLRSRWQIVDARNGGNDR